MSDSPLVDENEWRESAIDALDAQGPQRVAEHEERDVPYGHPEWGTCVCGAQWPCASQWWDDMSDDEKDATLNSAINGASDDFTWMDE